MQLIISHDQSDFDAVGATLGAWLLNQGSIPVFQARLNRNVREFVKLYRPELPFIDLVDIPNEPVESVLLVDTQSIATIKGVTPATKIQVIDHHSAKPDLSDDWVVKLDHTGACTTSFVEQIKKAGIKLSVTQATLLLLGIYEDTGSLTYSHTTSRDIHAAAFLVDQKASLKIAARFLNPPLSERQSQLYDQLLANVKVHEIQGLRVIFSTAEALGMDDEISSVAHKLREFLDPNALFILVRTNEGIRLVARSTTDEINVAELSAHFGGGGHERASAALIESKGSHFSSAISNLETVIQEILSILPECIHPAITVGQIMSHNPLLLPPETSAEEAAQLMQRYGYEGYPVVENHQVIGLLSRRAVDRSLAFKLNLPAGSLMDEGNISVTVADSIDHLQRVMTSSGWGQIPVMDLNSEKIVGIVTRTDLFKTITSRKGRTGPLHRYNLASRLETNLIPGKLALLKMVADFAHQQHTPLYIVGGFVRDLLLNRSSFDFDLVVEGDAIGLGQRLRQAFGGNIVSHKQFGTAKWLLNPIRQTLSERLQIQNFQDLPDSIDLISARIEFYDRPSALPTVERSSIKLDLHRRDFSINTLAMRLDGPHYGDLYDYWGGVNDLRQGVIRVLHSLSFVDDPTRMLRAIRFEQRFNFKIENRTLRLMKEAHTLVEEVSGDRLRHELDLIIQENNPLPIFQRANHLGLLSAINPYLQWTPEDTLWLEQLVKAPSLADWNIPEKFRHFQTRSILFYLLWFYRYTPMQGLSISKRLHFGKHFEDALQKFWSIKAVFPELPAMKPSQVYTALQCVPGVVIFAAYKISSSVEVQKCLYNYFSVWQFFKPNIDGKMLESYQIKSGPIYKLIIDQLRNAWLDGLVTTPSEELQLAQKLIMEYNLAGRE